jgi:hypothetical protein
MLPIGFFIQPAALWLILFLVARNEADRTFSTLFFLSIGIALMAIGLDYLIKPWDLLATPILCAIALRRFCCITWVQAVLASLLFIAWWFVYPLLWKLLLHPAL